LIVFTIEYLLRLWVSVEKNRKIKSQPILGRIRYMFSPMALIDLLAIAPVYFIFMGADLMIIRALRLVRIFKLTRYSRSMGLLIAVLKQEAETIISAIFILLILIVISATGIFLVEGDIQPKEFGSIPRALWWATVTLTTVGYGDVVPVTALGKVLGIVIVIMGIGMAALPAGIMASGFTSEINRRREHFKSKVVTRIVEGKLPKSERPWVEELRKELGISRADAGLMIYEARNESKVASHIDCPHCGEPVHIQHRKGTIKLRKKVK
jgi:voltage-gated potassium channel